MYDVGLGRGDFRAPQQFGQVHLVRAAQDRFRVVDDHQALGHGLAGQSVGVVIHVGGFANKEGIELEEPVGVLLGDQLCADAQLVGGFDEAFEGPGIGRRALLGRIV